jgi:catechol 2,3-dioxygenase-like lactoylglutathione lyase family enzyme
MSNPAAPPNIEVEQANAGFTVADVAAAVEFYTTRLGFRLGFTWGDPPTFAGVFIGDVQIFLRKDSDLCGCTAYFMVGDADELHAYHRANGVEVVFEPGDRDYGIRDYAVRDPWGNRLVFGHHITLADGPPIPIERVDVPVRLEKRLAALLYDLAEHKRMSVSSTLEEILLHTNEPLGDGVASPHTRRTLAYIQQLKQKHGIDYDSHGSYRFVEAT